MQYIARGLLIRLSSINHMAYVGLLCFMVGLVTGFSSIDHMTQILYFYLTNCTGCNLGDKDRYKVL